MLVLRLLFCDFQDFAIAVLWQELHLRGNCPSVETLIKDDTFKFDNPSFKYWIENKRNSLAL
jgi:hypothetical protein